MKKLVVAMMALVALVALAGPVMAEKSKQTPKFVFTASALIPGLAPSLCPSSECCSETDELRQEKTYVIGFTTGKIPDTAKRRQTIGTVSGVGNVGIVKKTIETCGIKYKNITCVIFYGISSDEWTYVYDGIKKNPFQLYKLPDKVKEALQLYYQLGERNWRPAVWLLEEPSSLESLFPPKP